MGFDWKLRKSLWWIVVLDKKKMGSFEGLEMLGMEFF